MLNRAVVRLGVMVVTVTLLASVAGCSDDSPAGGPSTPPGGSPASEPGPTADPGSESSSPARSDERAVVPPGPASIADRSCPPDHPAQARCFTLTVPADHADPDGPTIALPGTVLPATGPSPAPDPIVIPAGGPGYPGADDLGWAGSPWNEQRAIVLYDQRGTGDAAPGLECPQLDAAFVGSLQAAGSYTAERDAMTVARNECLADLRLQGVDLTEYHSEASAADLAALRVALGYDEWNIVGISYGGRLALATMRSQPAGIRSVILDSVYDVTYGGLASLVERIESALDRLADGCAADPACAATYGDLGVSIEEARQRYNTDPVQVTADLGDGAGPQQFVITGDDMVAGLFNALYDAELIPLLPGLIDGLRRGDTSIVPALIERGVSFATGYADAMATAVNCADNAALEAADDDGATFEDPGRLGLVVAQTGPCPSDWPATPGEFVAPVESTIPALVFAGSYDPVTPADGTRAVADRLANSTFVLVEPGGHGVAGFDDCTTEIGLAFLDDPSTPPDVSCVAAIPPPRFS